METLRTETEAGVRSIVLCRPDAYNTITPALRERLVVLAAPAPTRIRLELSGSREIIWGDGTQNGTKAQVATSLLARPGKVIDVSAPSVITVR